MAKSILPKRIDFFLPILATKHDPIIGMPSCSDGIHGQYWVKWSSIHKVDVFSSTFWCVGGYGRLTIGMEFAAQKSKIYPFFYPFFCQYYGSSPPRHKLLFLTFESEPFIDVTESTCIILTSFHLLGLLKLIYKSTNLALNEATIRACRLVWHPVSSILTVFPFAFPFARMETRSEWNKRGALQSWSSPVCPVRWSPAKSQSAYRGRTNKRNLRSTNY